MGFYFFKRALSLSVLGVTASLDGAQLQRYGPPHIDYQQKLHSAKKFTFYLKKGT